MIKKITLASAATLALLFIPAQASSCKGEMHADPKSEHAHKDHKDHKGHKKMHKKRHGSHLLMRLPSPMKIIMKHESDPKLALTAEQKSKLEAQRKDMMPKMMDFKAKIKTLSKEIKEACKKKVPAADQKDRIQKLSILKAEATMMKLTCIEKVKATLDEKQLGYMKELKKARMEKMKAMREKMKGMKMEVMKEMKAKKCQAGKCGASGKCGSK